MSRTTRRPAARRLWGVALLSCLAGLTACSSDAVPLSSPSTDGATEATCAALVEDLPGSVAGQQRRPVEPDDALGAAWGDPPVVLLCGGPKPEGQDVFATCTETEGVGWWAPDDQIADLAVDITLTSVGTEPLVQVTVPGLYRPEAAAAAITELGPSLRRHLDVVKRCR